MPCRGRICWPANDPPSRSARHRWFKFAGGRRGRPAVGGTRRAAVAAQAASGSRPWNRPIGCTARRQWTTRARWPGRRRATPRTAPAAPLLVGQPGRARSPPRQGTRTQVRNRAKPGALPHFRDPEDVARYAEAFKQLLEVAATGEDSLVLLKRITTEIRGT